ncbi:MAG: GNAT family N-acetyltransferase [Gammaproteobacteria bacterium]|nr:GNAT family N-acetyltransferase [Gammaproteobacteria bacterium]
MEYHPIRPDEFDGYINVLSHVFTWDPKPEEVEVEKKHIELDRTVGAFDDGRIVGTGANLTFEMTVPGGSLPAGGVTAIGVLPSHRRRGILNEMMARLFDDSRSHGEPLSILWASESSIYGRYGFGVATRHASREIERIHARLSGDAPPAVRIIDKDEALRQFPSVYETVRRRYPGMIRRTERKWEIDLADLEPWRDGATANRFGLFEPDGVPQGYVRYRVKEKWENGQARSELVVAELIAITQDAYRDLWRYVFGIDLIETIKARGRPVREPLEHMLANPRRLTKSVTEGIWLRILDVERALAGRRYSTEDRVVLEVTGPGDVAGRYLLEGGPDGATCRRTEAKPDLRLDIKALGMAYLGGHDFVTLAGASMAEGDAETLRRADLMFGWHEPTWCVVGF